MLSQKDQQADPQTRALMRREARKDADPRMYYPSISKPPTCYGVPSSTNGRRSRKLRRYKFNKVMLDEIVEENEMAESPDMQHQNGYASPSLQTPNGCANGKHREQEHAVRIRRRRRQPSLLRTVIGFWLLGLTNNYGYVIMISASYDIISQRFDSTEVSSANFTLSGTSVNLKCSEARDCNYLSTGSILIADILPGLLVKSISWLFPLAINARMGLVATMSALGFTLVGYSRHFWVAILGVIMTAISSGLGEASLLPYMAFFKDRRVISSWSSGTGAAGFLGSLSYIVLISCGFSMELTLYILNIIPCIMIVTFWGLMKHPMINDQGSVSVLDQMAGGPINYHVGEDVELGSRIYQDNGFLRKTTSDSMWEKIIYIPKLLPYMLPIGLVYFFEYFINQALFELVYFEKKGFVPDHSQQFRVYQLTYQLSVLISRSSYNYIKIKNIKGFAVVQGVIAILFLVGAIYSAFPGFSVVLIVIFIEGLIGGAAYVNTFQKINVEVESDKREFALAISSLADAIGITLAGILAIPAHNYICSLPVMHLESSDM